MSLVKWAVYARRESLSKAILADISAHRAAGLDRRRIRPI